MSFITQVQKPLGSKKSLFARCFQTDEQVFQHVVPPQEIIQKQSLIQPEMINSTKKLLILDLDETLVHSSFQPVQNADLTLNLDILDPSGLTTKHTVFVYKRPFLEMYLLEMSKHYDLCVFTASLQVYCDAVMDAIDPNGLVKLRLYRNHCTMYNNMYIKNVYKLGYLPENVIIVDNSPISFSLQPENGIMCSAFYDDKSDTYLRDCIDYMIELSKCSDVRQLLKGSK
ncbi:Nuclear LIM interactor-interacting factor [Spironucleus salmonicida]|uniref:Nuclear LIM interactor-interacting factor n=1 Tax=Spironucleus salmonicida TaxID=348837 RepID=V6LCX5_9EUKA|nr:Nuclear LIM interactor-interacting factor [Spironucleus salmonicida]|eukprot:EST41531.1 Nuclear LIM interactor-interacting factor [Spironucleus salmonicida]